MRAEIINFALGLVLAGPAPLAARAVASHLSLEGKTAPILPIILAGLAMAFCLALSDVAATPRWSGLGLGFALLALGAIDIMEMRLPDRLTLPLILAGLVVAALPGQAGLLDRLIGAAAGYAALAGLAAVFRHVQGRDGLGLGDAKLAAAAGAWLGWRALPMVVLIACAGGFAWVLLRWLRQGRKGLTSPLPFGAPLAAAIWLAWCWPQLVALGLTGLSLAGE